MHKLCPLFSISQFHVATSNSNMKLRLFTVKVPSILWSLFSISQFACKGSNEIFECHTWKLYNFKICSSDRIIHMLHNMLWKCQTPHLLKWTWAKLQMPIQFVWRHHTKIVLNLIFACRFLRLIFSRRRITLHK